MSGNKNERYIVHWYRCMPGVKTCFSCSSFILIKITGSSLNHTIGYRVMKAHKTNPAPCAS